MELALWLALWLFLWWLTGAISFIFWWTKDFDFTSNEVLMAFFMGFGGLVTFFIGWLLHGDNYSGSVLIKKRRNKL